ncbi:hypothetical protein BJF78_19415 [Pseudonocardia sp. CNS-139]|nr:hypothetical protein BJF78_19415 [Pseudonocardia sp. CNS-139]
MSAPPSRRATALADASSTGPQPVLDVRGLSVRLDTQRGPIVPVDDVSLQVRGGERVGLVGESGSGKSMTGKAVMRLLPRSGAHITAGSSCTTDGTWSAAPTARCGRSGAAGSRWSSRTR